MIYRNLALGNNKPSDGHKFALESVKKPLWSVKYIHSKESNYFKTGEHKGIQFPKWTITIAFPNVYFPVFLKKKKIKLPTNQPNLGFPPNTRASK